MKQGSLPPSRAGTTKGGAGGNTRESINMVAEPAERAKGGREGAAASRVKGNVLGGAGGVGGKSKGQGEWARVAEQDGAIESGQNENGQSSKKRSTKNRDSVGGGVGGVPDRGKRTNTANTNTRQKRLITKEHTGKQIFTEKQASTMQQ